MFDLTGKTTKDLLNIDIETFNKLNMSEMKSIVSRLSRTANRRLQTFDIHNETSPATRYISRSGGKFSTKNKNLNELRSEYMRVKNFLNSITGSYTGWSNVKNRTISTLKTEKNIHINEDDFGKFWKAYEKLKEINPEISVKRLKYAVLKDISNVLTDKDIDVDSLVDDMRKKISKIYEENEDDDRDISEFFEF